MNELPVFISYRQADGTDLALWVFNSIRGRTLILRNAGIHVPAAVTPVLDRAAAAGSESQNRLSRRLEESRALILICTPGAAHEFTEGVDWLYREIRWWLERREAQAPILVCSRDQGIRWVPEIVSTQWPGIHVVQIEPALWRNAPYLPSRLAEVCIESILGGVARSVGDQFVDALVQPWQDVGMVDIPGLFTWAKDRQYRYTDANENYARAAGFDSPRAMLGKTDEAMPWRSLVPLFRDGDERVMSSAEGLRACVPEKEIMVDRVADILVTESAVRDRGGKVVGLTGCFLDITGLTLSPRELRGTVEGVSLGNEFGNDVLSGDEAGVFKGLVAGWPTQRIAEGLGMTIASVEEHMAALQRKFQCSTISEIVPAAVRAGLPLALFGPRLEG